MRPLLVLAVLTLASASSAAELPLEKIAEVQLAEAAALEKVAAKYGHRPSSELTTEERREMIRDQQRALEAVQTDTGVSQKEYARAVARLTPEENRAVAKKIVELKAQRAKAKAGPEPAVEIYEGLDESQLEQLDSPLPADGGVQVLLPNDGAPPAEDPVIE